MSDSFSQLKAWTLLQENLTGLKVGVFCIDNGELKSAEMNTWLASRGTGVRYTAPYTSAHIGRVERLHRTLMGKARAMRDYCTILISSAVTGHKPSGYGRNRCFVPGHRRGGRLWQTVRLKGKNKRFKNGSKMVFANRNQ